MLFLRTPTGLNQADSLVYRPSDLPVFTEVSRLFDRGNHVQVEDDLQFAVLANMDALHLEFIDEG